MFLICSYCKKEFGPIVPSSKNKRKCCSKECQYNLQKVKKIKKLCKHCGKEFESLACKERIFCSNKCRSIEHRNIQDPSFRKCSNCKKVKSINKFSKSKDLIEYRCKECLKNRTRKQTLTPHGRFLMAKSVARRRHLEWDVEEIEYTELMKLKCHYCNDEISRMGVGLDRKDNNLGYLKNNIIPCCKLCNWIKSDYFSYEEMIEISETVKLIKKRRMNDR